MARSRRAAPARRPAPRARPASRPASTQARPPAPQQSSVPAPQQQSGGMMGGIMGTIAQGMAFGTGSAVAHRAVGAVAESFSGGGGSEQQAAPEYAAGAMPDQQLQQASACGSERQIYYDCLRDNRDDGAVCQFLLEQVKACNENQMYS